MMYRMLDLYSGRKGASSAMVVRGWEVVTVDINPDFQPDIVADILNWDCPFTPGYFDLVWSSLPCTFFSRYIQRGIYKNEPVPSLEHFYKSKEIIQLLIPNYWVIENVRGAVKFFGSNYQRYGSYFLWGNIPRLPIKLNRTFSQKSLLRDPSLRALIPNQISSAIAYFIENQLRMFAIENKGPVPLQRGDRNGKLVQ